MQLILKEPRLQYLQTAEVNPHFQSPLLQKFNVAFLQCGISNDTHKIKQLKSEI